jgi:hypothetical protein
MKQAAAARADAPPASESDRCLFGSGEFFFTLDVPRGRKPGWPWSLLS